MVPPHPIGVAVWTTGRPVTVDGTCPSCHCLCQTEHAPARLPRLGGRSDILGCTGSSTDRARCGVAPIATASPLRSEVAGSNPAPRTPLLREGRSVMLILRYPGVSPGAHASRCLRGGPTTLVESEDPCAASPAGIRSEPGNWILPAPRFPFGEVKPRGLWPPGVSARLAAVAGRADALRASSRAS